MVPVTEKPCARCGGPAATHDNIAETSFWGKITMTQTLRETTQALRFQAAYIIRNPRIGGSGNMLVDETKELCGDCWGLLVGRFMQGRSVPAMEGKA